MKKVSKVLLSFAMILMLGVSFLLVGCGSQTYTIDLVSNNSSYGTVVGTGEYKRGEYITLIAEANEGYYFEQWSDGNTDWKRQVRVKGDSIYTAIFRQGGYTVEYNGFKIVILNGTAEFESEFLRLSPNDNGKFSYWYKGLDSNKIFSVHPEQGLRLSEINGNAIYSAVHSLVGFAFTTYSGFSGYEIKNCPINATAISNVLGDKYSIHSSFYTNVRGYELTNGIDNSTQLSYSTDVKVDDENDYFVIYKIFLLENQISNAEEIYFCRWGLYDYELFTVSFDWEIDGVEYDLEFTNNIND